VTTPRPIVNVDSLFRRVTGAVALAHHRLQLLRDSDEHEAATLEIIRSAQHHIFIENYRLAMMLGEKYCLKPCANAHRLESKYLS